LAWTLLECDLYLQGRTGRLGSDKSRPVNPGMDVR
jgi:hypothetical protein